MADRYNEWVAVTNVIWIRGSTDEHYSRRVVVTDGHYNKIISIAEVFAASASLLLTDHRYNGSVAIEDGRSKRVSKHTFAVSRIYYICYVEVFLSQGDCNFIFIHPCLEPASFNASPPWKPSSISSQSKLTA